MTNATVYGIMAEAAEAAEQRASSAALVQEGGTSTTLPDLVAAADVLAGQLAARGFRRGDRIAAWLPNSIDWQILFVAGARLGVLVIPVNTRYRSFEVEHILAATRPRAIVFQPEFRGIDFAGLLREVLGSLDCTIGLEWLEALGTVGPSSEEMLPRTPQFFRMEDLLTAGPAASSTSGARPEDPVVVFGTSGTTSAPKLAMHANRGIADHVSAVARRLELDENDVVLCFLPPCGAYGFVEILASLVAGARAVLVPEFEIRDLVGLIERHQVTVFATTELIMREALRVGEVRRDQLRSLRQILMAGVSIADITDRVTQLSGAAVTNVYGSSEVLALAAIRSRDDAAQRVVPGGRVTSTALEVRAVDTVSGREVDGGDGELQFRGQNVFTGYLGNDDATSQAFTPEGWYHSRDRGQVTEGGKVFTYQARSVDTLRLKGFLVDPAEIEELLIAHEAVEFAQVVGIVDPASGEHRAVAFVVLAPGRAVEPDVLKSHCRALAASYKTPEVVHVTTSLPMASSANGDKVKKDELRRMAESLLEWS